MQDKNKTLYRNYTNMYEMNKNKLSILAFLFVLIINISSATPEALISKTKMQVEVQCLSDDIYVTRYFYIPNTDLDKTLNLNAQNNRYIFFVGKELEPILINSFDNYGNIYQENFIEDEGLKDFKIIDYYFPPQDIKIKPRDEFLITTRYKATAGILFEENGAKKLKFETATIGNKELEEFKIILPDCFGFKREFIDATPKPTSMNIIDNNLILSYNKPLLHSILNISSDINTTNIYDPGVRFSYRFDLFGLIGYIFTLIFGALIGIFLDRKLNSKKK